MAQMNASAHEGGSRAAHAAAADFNDDEDVNLEFSDEKDLAASGTRERHSNRHHQASQEAKGSGNTKKKLHPISEARPQQNLGALGQKKRGQGISSRQAEEELKRNNRVVSIREDAQTGRRRKQRKTG
jgi:hypothetical protein